MNYERWKHLKDYNQPPDCMDWRHVQMVHAVLHHEKLNTVVEIGCARGFSTSAILEEAETSETPLIVDLVDPCIGPEFVNLVSSIKPKHSDTRIHTHSYDSREYPGTPEYWLIDGNHWEGALIDYQNALSRKAKVIMIHDTHSHSFLGGHGGTKVIAEKLLQDAPFIFQDFLERPSEITHRGVAFGFFQQPKDSTLAALKSLT